MCGEVVKDPARGQQKQQGQAATNRKTETEGALCVMHVELLKDVRKLAQRWGCGLEGSVGHDNGSGEASPCHT